MDFLRLTDTNGQAITVSSSSDPSTAELDVIISGVHADMEERTAHSWGRLGRSTEIHDVSTTYDWGRGMAVHLQHYNVQPFDASEGDTLEMWNGNEWQNRMESSDYTLLGELGQMYIRVLFWLGMLENRIRVSYRYGTPEMPGGMRYAAIKKCAVELIRGSLSMDNIQFSDSGRIDKSVESWEQDYDEMVLRWQHWMRVEY